MRNVPALARREMNTLFFSPLAYTILTILLLFSGLFFVTAATEYKEATKTVNALTGLLNFLFIVATPLLTMRLLSEEYRSGNIENLMTAPVTETEVILSKFLGALVLYGSILVSTLVYPVILSFLGRPDWGIIFTSYAGLLLMGFQFVALGVFCSSLTQNQIVAGILALVLQMGLWLLGPIGNGLSGPLRAVAQYASALDHLIPFLEGRIAFRDVLYFVSLGFFWLFLAVRVLESKRWR